MGFDPKKVSGEVDRWSSLIVPPAAGADANAQAIAPLFYDFTPQDEFSRGTKNEYEQLVQGRRAVAGAAEIAPPQSSFKGLLKFKR